MTALKSLLRPVLLASVLLGPPAAGVADDGREPERGILIDVMLLSFADLAAIT